MYLVLLEDAGISIDILRRLQLVGGGDGEGNRSWLSMLVVGLFSWISISCIAVAFDTAGTGEWSDISCGAVSTVV